MCSACSCHFPTLAALCVSPRRGQRCRNPPAQVSAASWHTAAQTVFWGCAGPPTPSPRVSWYAASLPLLLEVSRTNLGFYIIFTLQVSSCRHAASALQMQTPEFMPLESSIYLKKKNQTQNKFIALRPKMMAPEGGPHRASPVSGGTWLPSSPLNSSAGRSSARLEVPTPPRDCREPDLNHSPLYTAAARSWAGRDPAGTAEGFPPWGGLMQRGDGCSALARLRCSPQASKGPWLCTIKHPLKLKSKGSGVSFLLLQPIK